jgi:predicted nucleic acid-binding protein
VSQVAYLDSSAVVKTVVEEPGSRALHRFLSDFETHASSELARTEVVRAVRRAQPSALARAFTALERLVLIELSETILDAAGLLEPPTLRTLDALHLATARGLSAQLGALVTYDERMAVAGTALGLPIETPR